MTDVISVVFLSLSLGLFVCVYVCVRVSFYTDGCVGLVRSYKTISDHFRFHLRLRSRQTFTTTHVHHTNNGPQGHQQSPKPITTVIKTRHEGPSSHQSHPPMHRSIEPSHHPPPVPSPSPRPWWRQAKRLAAAPPVRLPCGLLAATHTLPASISTNTTTTMAQSQHGRLGGLFARPHVVQPGSGNSCLDGVGALHAHYHLLQGTRSVQDAAVEALEHIAAQQVREGIP
mmetsp:Transcript_24999/g.72151  ORF Transcript_24999/g.72151 Transcript_24999/m.72151 type:complete len:228 (-) Transcript_24999:1476-2159(-)